MFASNNLVEFISYGLLKFYFFVEYFGPFLKNFWSVFGPFLSNFEPLHQIESVLGKLWKLSWVPY